MPRRARPDRPLDPPRRTAQAASSDVVLCRVPWVAMDGSQALPVVITACRCRRIAAAITVCAWVGGELVLLPAGQAPIVGCVDGVGALGSPHCAPRGHPQSGPSLPGEFGAADECAGRQIGRAHV